MKFSARQIEAAKSRHSLAGLIGRSVTLKQHGADFIGLCPFHKEKTPSFHVVEERGFYWCFGCGANGDAVSWLMRDGLSFRDAVGELLGEDHPDTGDDAALSRAETARAAEQERRRARMTASAIETWRASVPIPGTPGEAYFRGRGITLTLPPSLRYLDRCAHGTRENRRWLPAVICGVQAPDRSVIAVHRIYLDPAATVSGAPAKTKLSPDKALLGSPGAGAIRLAAAGERLGLAEGIETALSVMQALPELPIWCAISAGRLPAIWLPDIVRHVIYFADRDRADDRNFLEWPRGDRTVRRPNPNFGRRPGEYWARRAAQEFLRGRRGGSASIAAPPGEKVDFNDMLQHGRE